MKNGSKSGANSGFFGAKTESKFRAVLCIKSKVGKMLFFFRVKNGVECLSECFLNLLLVKAGKGR